MDNVSARQIKFVCSGRVMSSASVALGNHRVELWDAEQVCPDLIACAYTDSSGRFTASLEPAYLATHFLDRDPVLSFKIFNGSAQLVTPHQVWRASATPATLRFVMADALVGREEPRQFVVRGQVTDGRGPLAGLRVEAFNKNLRDEEPLRDDYETLPILTDDNGDYVIQYDGGNIGAENKKNADLFLKVYDEEDAVIATTEVYCHAPPAVTVDIVVGAGTYVGPSVYERLSAALTPMLGSYAWDELTEEEASYLACRGTEDEEVVQALRKAHALALAIDVEPNITFALLRRGLPETRRDLLRMAPSAWRRELVAASAANLIVPMDETALDAAVTSLRVAAAALAFETPDAGTTCNFSDILEVALPTLGDRQTFVDEYIAHEGTIEELWTHVGTLSGFDAPTIARTQLALQWGALTRYHLPLVKQLEVMRATTHPTLKDLAKLSESDWAALLELEIDEVPIGAPADVPGADETARRATYAKVLVRTMETAFPTAAFTERLRIDVGDTDERYLFLVANPTFELGKTRAGSFFATADFGALDMEAVKADLLAVERLFKIAPRYEDMSVLLNDEIRSAGAVHRMGETRFLAKYSEALGLESAKKVFRKACYVSAASTFLMAKYGAAFHALGATTSERPPIHVLPDLASSLSDPPVDVADWVTLFGSPDVCACEDCQSVTSPAAYLVDLLEFLAGIESTVTRLDDSKLSGAEVLLGDGTVPGRRPDIARLALSCANTNVALPYIDLVNELLELRIAEETVATTIDTTRTAAELLAMPEDLFPEARTAAYAAAAGAVHPWTLPFDFFGEEARVYLDHMGVPRDALMTLFQQPTGSAEEGPLPSAATLARERLRLAPVDYELITTGTTAGATPEGLWGRSGAGWEAALLSVPTFLGASGLSYDELLELIDTTLLSELASGTPSIDADGDPCVLTNLTIGGLGSSLADIWDVVHRFLRLRTRLGCSISELDKIVYAFIFGASSPPTSVAEIASAFDDGLLTRIADLRRLVSALRLPIDEALSYWAPMDRHAVPSTKAISLYERVFLSRATQNLAVDDPFVDPSSGTLQDHRDRILSALGISATDFVLLTDAATAARELTLPPAVDSAFNVANLSHLYRIVSFTRALRMPLADFLVLRGLAGFDPLLGASPAQPQDTLNFVEITAKIRSAKVNIAELHYLLRHVTRPTSGVAAEDVLRDQRLAALDAKLQKVAELRAVPVDPSGRVLVGLLETVLGTAEPDSTDIHATAQALLDICLELSALSYAEKQTLLDTSLSDVLGDAFDDVIATLLGDVTGTPPPTLTVPEERVDYLQGVLHDFLLRLDAVTTVKEHLTETFAVPAETVAGLIEGSAAEASWLLAFSDPTAGLLEDFLLPAAGDPPTPPDEKTKAMTLFSKAARVIHWVCPNDATAFDVATLFGASRNTAWLDLAALPYAAPLSVDGDGASLDGLLRLLDVSALSGRIRAGRSVLFDLLRLDAPDGDEWLDSLAVQTGWDRTDLGTLSTAFDWSFATDVRDEAKLTRFADAFDALRRLGVDATTALDWASPDAETPVAADVVAVQIKQAAKAKHPETTWLDVARPLRDVLRERQRASLLAYVIESGTSPTFSTANDVYAELLVDPEMSACQLTSRIKLAISSIQLFVQRALLQLETSLSLGPSDAARWKWMKHYRVWEAGRKIFMFPENWIEPELRDDKTPFFKDLENELRQRELTDASADRAYERYLERLQEVAHLDICGMFHEREEETETATERNLLHVFGRTFSLPHRYFYRTQVDEVTWTPWEDVPVDVEGDVFLPLVHDRTLQLYWLREVEKDREDQKSEQNPTQLITTLIRSTRGQAWSAPAIVGAPYLHYPFLQDKTWLALGYDLATATLEELERWTAEPSDIYLRVQKYSLDGCRVLQNSSGGEAVLWLPFQTQTRHMDAAELSARTNDVLAIPMVTEGVFGATYGLNDVLLVTPTPFRTHAPLMKTPVISFPGHPVDPPRTEFFFKDDERTFFVHVEDHTRVTWSEASKTKPSIPGAEGLDDDAKAWADAPSTTILIPSSYTTYQVEFETFYHPHVCAFVAALRRDGVAGLRDWNDGPTPLQLLGADSTDTFEATYQPTELVKTPYPLADVDFRYGGPYSAYNWEVFFHIPFHIAVRLSKNQRFEEAQKWFHAIFDPTDRSTTDSELGPVAPYWKFLPFIMNKNLSDIQGDFLELAEDESIAMLKAMFVPDDEGDGTRRLAAQIDAWRRDPFNPHLLARLRLVAYQKAVVMRYLDNLIEWGDSLFRRDTIEAINEAAQLYVLASEILGPKPTTVRRPATTAQCYADLEDDVDTFGNAVENVAPAVNPGGKVAKAGTHGGAMCGKDAPLPMLNVLYFCVPRNDKLLGYWDKVADRLFKIRHCMNIEGVVRQLPLFEPPIDPALLVQAKAAGVDIESVLNDTYTPRSCYRFSTLLSKASELAAAVAGLGQALLSALEKDDGEALSRLRSTHEIDLLKTVRETRKQQIEEARQNLRALEDGRRAIDERYQFYSTREKLNFGEELGIFLSEASAVCQATAAALQTVATVVSAFPDTTVYAMAPPSVTYGGSQLGSALGASASAVAGLGGVNQTAAGLSFSMASFERRQDDWRLQVRIALRELAQIDKQIVAAKIRIAIAEAELATHDKQAENATAVDTYFREKYTNEDLYEWMGQEVSTLYFQAYKLAFDMARRAERAYQFERGEPSKTFVEYGYWDSLRKGLVAAERLQYALRTMDAAYLVENRRELEITKHVSLADQFPKELLALRAAGTVEVSLSKAHFDWDYPGHYMRRLKTLSVTIPGVGGSYTSVNATLTLLSNTIHTQASQTSAELTDYVPLQSICTSGAQNDSGVFELTFRDERYLPFEGAGAVATLRLELPQDTNTFDLATVSDVVFHLRYTARDGGAVYREAVRGTSEFDERPALRMFSVRSEFPAEWRKFFDTLDETDDDQVLELPISAADLPFLSGGTGYEFTDVTVVFDWTPAVTDSFAATLTIPGTTPAEEPRTIVAMGQPISEAAFDPDPLAFDEGAGPLLLAIAQTELATHSGLTETFPETANKRLREDKLRDIFVIVTVARS